MKQRIYFPQSIKKGNKWKKSYILISLYTAIHYIYFLLIFFVICNSSIHQFCCLKTIKNKTHLWLYIQEDSILWRMGRLSRKQPCLFFFILPPYKRRQLWKGRIYCSRNKFFHWRTDPLLESFYNSGNKQEVTEVVSLEKMVE